MEFRVQDHLDELRSPAVFGLSGAVELIQTHISVVALCGARAFKFKKSVRLPFLDFSSRDLRERACRDELQLNRRLAPSVYLDVLPLQRTEAGLRLGRPTAPDVELLDHAVVMERLPADRMLDVELQRGDVDEESIRRLARTLASFHARQRSRADDTVRRDGSPDKLIGFLRGNFDETRPLRGALFDAALHLALEEHMAAALPSLRTALEGRAGRGAIVDGHGDFHARNVCMLDPPVIYDCLEFRRDMRCGDVAGEVAFMAMDLRYRGRGDLARAFAAEYVSATGDPDLHRVLGELLRYRAMVRAKVDAIGAADPTIEPAVRDAQAKAGRRHLRLCAYTILEERAPRALVAVGLPGSGKSFVFDELARESGWPSWSTDRVRKELCGVAPTDRLPPSAYDSQISARVYAEVLDRASASPGVVLVDGNFARHALRRRARALLGRDTLTVWFQVEPTLARQRLRARSARGDSASDADAAVFDALAPAFEAPGPDEEDVIVLDGAAERESLLDRIATALIAPPEFSGPR